MVVFEGARVITGDSGAAIDNATILVEGTSVTQVSPSVSVSVPAGARRVSLAGKTVMPAIVACTHRSLTKHTRMAFA